MLAEKLGYEFVDADGLHPQENVDKMTRGQPLTDEDRKPWLEICNKVMRQCVRVKEKRQKKKGEWSRK